jgi:hypothetical protein
MRLETLLAKEVYIRLAENETAFVCTVRYAGILGKSRQFALRVRPEVLRDLEEEGAPVIRTDNHTGRTGNHFGAGPQGED